MKLYNYKKSIKTLFMSSWFKEIINISFYFFICYIFMILLNGENLNLKSLIKFDNFWWKNIKDVFFYVFQLKKIIYNFAVFIVLYLLISGVTNKIKLSCTIISTCTIIFGILNYIVKQIRGAAITISDVFSINTVLKVTDGIKIQLNSNCIVSILLFIIINVLLWKFIKFESNRSLKSRIIKIIIGFIGFIIIFIRISKWNLISEDFKILSINDYYEEFGTNVTIIKMIQDLHINKPDNYNTKEIIDKLENYKDETQDFSGNLPNIIVVINESFADFCDVYNYDDVKEDNLKYFHEIIKEENVVSGIMHSSWYGYGTANVEYEFLTQNTTAFLPKGSVPYQQYIIKNVKQSIVEYMNKLGYNTYGIHSYSKFGYNRFKVYELLQFKNSIFIEDMKNIEASLNRYPSDSSTYSYWYEIMRKKNKKEKNFTFIMTMQNHIPYNRVDSKRTQYSRNKELNSYLQGEEQSDEALKELVDFIKKYDEDTVLLFFGDHQPNLNILNNEEIDSKYLKEEVKYIIPFVIFANFDISEQSNIEISTNYLQNLLFDVLKMPKNSYTKYVEELRNEIPIITANYYKDRDGNLYNIQDKTSPYYEKIKEYWEMIYYQMFDI